MYDVFLSFTRTGGHEALVGKIRQRLIDAGFSVFIDRKVAVADSISDKIRDALGASRIMLVVYSATYNERWACQWELIHAYLAAAAEGYVRRRILVVNPEPGDDHIVPIDAADAKFLSAGNLGELEAEVRQLLAQAPGPMRVAQRPAAPDWLLPDIPGSPGFTGRFIDLWRVHNVLTAQDKPLTRASPVAGAAVLTGMPGIGKSSLARAYGWLFGGTYPGGIFFLSAGRSGGLAAARARFGDEVRELADRLGIVTGGETPERIVSLVGDWISGQDGPSLWIVDDLPSQVDAETVRKFAVPSGRVRTLFTARSAPGGVHEVPLTGLSMPDALALLRSGRPTSSPADLAAAMSIVTGVGGHPLALTAAAARLQDTEGLLSYQDYAQRLAAHGPDPDIRALIGDFMGTPGHEDRVVIMLARLLGSTPLPAPLVSAVLASTGSPPPRAAELASEALKRLRRSGFAVPGERGWRIHPLAVDADAQLGAPPYPAAQLAQAAARELVSLLHGRPGAAELIANARALAGADGLDPALASTLRRLVARHSEQTGDLGQAAALWRQVAETAPGAPADQVEAALACVANAEFGWAVAHLTPELIQNATGDLAVRARWALAAALDGLGQFAEADAGWDWLASASWDPAPAQRLAFDVARARAMLARGRLNHAQSVLDQVLTEPGEAYADQVNAARIEMARLLMWTSRERPGREMAESVVRYYRDHGAPGHALCMEAELLWTEAVVSLGMFELRANTGWWTEAEATLDRLAEEYPRAAGPQSLHGLTVTVLRGLLQVRLGHQRAARHILLPVLPTLRERLGERHPLLLRARYGLGLVHLQLQEYADGARLLGDVWQAQRDTIGPGHPDTLHSELHYGIGLWQANLGPEARKRSSELIADVRARLPREIGWRNDLYGQAWMAQHLTFVPPQLANAVQRLDGLPRWLQEAGLTGWRGLLGRRKPDA